MTARFPRDHAALAAREDPSLRQRGASDPGASVWVDASAGTGKTKVLTDRVLRLLLPREDGAPGTPPHRILCLTYTKAAAGEMALRVNKTLRLWAVAPDAALDRMLSGLLGREPLPEERRASRRLFTRVVDAPGGLNIMTVHSFCQSVLGRFPLEAGLPPRFTTIEDGESAGLLRQARDSVLARGQRRPESPEGQALARLAAEQTEEQFDALLQSLIAERRQLREIIRMHGAEDRYAASVRRAFGVASDDTPESLEAAACADGAFDAGALRAACRALLESGSPTDGDLGRALDAFLSVPADRRRLNPLLKALTTEDRDTKRLRPRQKLGTKKALAAFPGCAEVLRVEAERLIAAADRINACRSALLTLDLTVLGRAIGQVYEDLKAERAGLDFDDLIQRTLELFRREGMAGWVLYKLDGGLDHILIDEAQDTNPEQWDIIEALTAEFFAGQGARESPRTVFTVGDEKQSIYSFQRAAPEKFAAKRAEFRSRVQASGQSWADVGLDMSFRSAPAVLDFVDAVYAADRMRAGLGRNTLRHVSWRHGHAGLVELWPLYRTPPAQKDEDTGPSPVPRTRPNARALLAERIAATVAGWIGDGDMLASRGRPVGPGDVLVLVRRRSDFVEHLIRALKRHGVPVGGLDRMALQSQLAVRDLMAAAQAALLPEDDLTLACVLKSPFIGFDDGKLEALALRRGGRTLWEALRDSGETDAVEWLRQAIARAGADRPYEFFSRLLQSPCPADPVSGLHAVTARLGDEALDPLNEFMNEALARDSGHVSSLQGFLLSQAQSNRDIKREQEAAGGKVRIMTIHAAKGLQAPVVFLPDTVMDLSTGRGKGAGRLVWPDKTGLDVPLWTPRRDMEPEAYRRAHERVRNREMEEYRRLLYVALTRAEDRLYLCGAEGRGSHAESWYHGLSAAFSLFDGFEDIAYVPPEGLDPSVSRSAMRIGNPQTASPDAGSASDAPAETVDLQSCPWLRTRPPEDPFPPRPLTPSRPSAEEPSALSPLAAPDDYRFLRGRLTHKLLQILPDLPSENRAAAALAFVRQPAHGLPEQVAADIVRETLAVIENPLCAPLFGPSSLAEAPVTGLTGGRLVSGQIDRILVTDDSIWIIDYKTNRPPPARAEDAPAAYRAQMEAYAAALSAIWPGRTVRAFLLWTDGARLMELPVKAA